MRVYIFFGTQSGTAQDYAEQMAVQAYSRNIEYAVKSLSEIEPITLPIMAQEDGILLFIVSTTGDGETPKNMTTFWRHLLHKDLSDRWLRGVRCGVLGLGDSSYEKFCFVGKRLFRRLVSLGATMVVSRRDADEQHSLGQDYAFNQWSFDVWQYLNQNYGTPVDPVRSTLSKVSLQPLSSNTTISQSENAQHEGNNVKFVLESSIRITPLDYWQDVRHLTFSSVTDLPIQYSPGDVAVISPVNSLSDVNKLLQILQWTPMANVQFRIIPSRSEVRIVKQRATLSELLLKYLDIMAPPKRSFFRVLSTFTEDAFVREKLDELASPEGLDLYLDYVWRPRRRPIEVLNDFKLKHGPVPPNYIFDLFPPLRPREYSIASSSVACPGKVDVCAAIVKYKTILPVSRWGVASRYINQLAEDAKDMMVSMHIRRGTWRLPEDDSTVLCMFAAGTGIAPIRALIQHSAHLTPTRPMYLFFGCRNIQSDYHYKDEWSRYAQLTVHVMGSRDEPGPRRHVDQLIRHHSTLIRGIIGRGAWVYIAGNAKLPLLVKKTLREIGSDPSQCTLFIEAWS